ncbi:MAG: family 20 glycosylhydrolase [Candidatus Cryptobacteroides sp.]
MYRKVLISALAGILVSGAIFTGCGNVEADNVILPRPAEIIENDGIYAFAGEPAVEVAYSKGPAEGYTLKISRKGIRIIAADDAGEFYARQSLAQMLAAAEEVEGMRKLQCCTIRDYPRFPYRGLHIDVSRHFFSIDFLKKQVDAMAMFKMNRLHLHLTDAAGWRMEIDSWPRLTEYAAWRPEANWKAWWNGKRDYVEEGTPGAYGGYYTKEELRSLVEYAAERHIVVIPEIEMPGHSEEVLAAYPEAGCGGEPESHADLCIGKELTFKMLQDILDEVIEVFPSEYIHIGGDEAGKLAWKTCPDCRRRMEEERLANVDELQSYMIRRIEKYLNGKGRKIIGWDEILEGGVSETATVMSWRGTEGGISAMNKGNDVIMCPGSFCYLDKAQDAPFLEPESIGGYLPLEKVYGYEPVESSMPKDGLDRLLGVQANLWTEYVPTESHAEHMLWPRAAAIAEIGWSPAASDGSQRGSSGPAARGGYPNFRRRALLAMNVLKEKGYNVFDLANEYGERKASLSPAKSIAKGCKITYLTAWNKSYPASGEITLVDGQLGGWANNDGRWMGFLSNIDVIIDLGQMTDIHYVGATFLQSSGPGIFMPERTDILISDDGENFEFVGECKNDVPTSDPNLLFKDFNVACNAKARYVRYKAYRNPEVKAWLFVDEIVVN